MSKELPFQVGILTVSDSCYQKTAEDKSGKKLFEKIRTEQCIGHAVVGVQEVVPDEQEVIASTLRQWCDDRHLDLILTTGGTGFSPRDVTPEATRTVIQREAPGLTIAMVQGSLRVTQLAMLSRPVCGIRGCSLIVNLPGSTKASSECLDFICPALPHALDLLRNNKENIGAVHRQLQSGKGDGQIVYGHIDHISPETPHGRVHHGKITRGFAPHVGVTLDIAQHEVATQDIATQKQSLQDIATQKQSLQGSQLEAETTLEVANVLTTMDTQLVGGPVLMEHHPNTGPVTHYIYSSVPGSVQQDPVQENPAVLDSTDIVSDKNIQTEYYTVSHVNSANDEDITTIRDGNSANVVVQGVESGAIPMQQNSDIAMNIVKNHRCESPDIDVDTITNSDLDQRQSSMLASILSSALAAQEKKGATKVERKTLVRPAILRKRSTRIRRACTSTKSKGSLEKQADLDPAEVYTFKEPDHVKPANKRGKKDPLEGVRGVSLHKRSKTDGEITQVPVGAGLKDFLHKHKSIQGIYLNHGKRQVKRHLVSLKRQESAVDCGRWLRGDQVLERNRLDDMFELTDRGRQHADQVAEGSVRDQYVVNWYLWCPGRGNCQRKCGGIGQCAKGCKGMKHKQDRHNCSLLINLKLFLGDLSKWRVHLTGHHLPPGLAIAWQPPDKNKERLDEDMVDIVVKAAKTEGSRPKDVQETLSIQTGNVISMRRIQNFIGGMMRRRKERDYNVQVPSEDAPRTDDDTQMDKEEVVVVENAHQGVVMVLHQVIDEVTNEVTYFPADPNTTLTEVEIEELRSYMEKQGIKAHLAPSASVILSHDSNTTQQQGDTLTQSQIG